MDASVRLRQNRVGGINKKNKAQDLVRITCNAIGSQIRKKKSFCKHLQKRKKNKLRRGDVASVATSRGKWMEQPEYCSSERGAGYRMI